MLVLSLLASVAFGAEETYELSSVGDVYGLAADCSGRRSATAVSSQSFELVQDVLSTTDPLKLNYGGSFSTCDVALTNISLTIDGRVYWTRRLNVVGTPDTNGEPQELVRSINVPAISELILDKGEHTVEVTLTGLIALKEDRLVVWTDGRMTVWRDRDDDGDADDRLTGGGDCDDNNEDVWSGAIDLDDELDNDCDGTVDNDDDSDGLNDALEAMFGLDPAVRDTDGDGAADGLEWGDDPDKPLDSDDDGVYDAADLDSDNDGLPDRDEFGNRNDPVDSDQDDLPDYRDPDDDNDGLPTKEESEGDFDGDGLTDHLDPDSDNDGALDGAEGTSDRDGDGVPNHHDTGSDIRFKAEPGGQEGQGFGLGCATSPALPWAGGWLLLVALVTRRRR